MLDSLYVLDLRLAAARLCDSPRSVLRDARRNRPAFVTSSGRAQTSKRDLHTTRTHMLDTLYVLDLRLTAAWPCDSPRSVPCDAGRNGPDLLRAVGALRHQSETVVPRADTCSTVCMCSICDWLLRGRATAPAASCAMRGEVRPICYEQWAPYIITVRPSHHAQTHARQLLCARFAIGCRAAVRQPPKRSARCGAKWARFVTSSGRAQTSK